MSNRKYIISGIIYSSLALDEFLLLLNEHDISSSLGDSSHCANNAYIKIEEGIEDLILEKHAEDYDARGYSFSSTQIKRVAELVSNTLTILDISHAFEIYVDPDTSKKLELIYCLSHNDPPQTF